VRACLTAALLTLVGCSFVPSHIHDDNKAKIAQAAQSSMTDYVKGAPAMYSTMTSNAQLFSSQEDLTLANYSYLAAKSLVHVYSLETSEQDLESRAECIRHFEKELWMLLSPGNTSEFGGCGTVSVKVLTEDDDALVRGTCNAYEQYPAQLIQLKDSLAGLKPGVPTVVSTGNTVQDLQANVTSLKGRLTLWNEDIALLNAAVSKLPTSGSNKDTENGILQVLTTGVKTLEGTQITYVNADGTKVTTTASQVISDVAAPTTGTQSDPQSVLDAVSKKWTNPPPGAPGIDLQIATLSLTLAQLEQQKTQRQLTLYQQAQQAMNQARAELEVSAFILNNGSAATPDEAKYTIFKDVVLASQGKGACVWQGSNGSPYASEKEATCASTKLQMMRNAMIAETIVARNYSSIPVKLARFNHQLSISESEVNAQQYQTLISSGLTGTAAYQNGGLTSQEVGNVISFGQAVAVAVLAGTVP
jgi:hypothetical protein